MIIGSTLIPARILFKRNDDIVYMSYLNDTTNSHIVFQDDLEYTYSDYYWNYEFKLPGLFPGSRIVYYCC